jgi:hypothetical protein
MDLKRYDIPAQATNRAVIRGMVNALELEMIKPKPSKTG